MLYFAYLFLLFDFTFILLNLYFCVFIFLRFVVVALFLRILCCVLRETLHDTLLCSLQQRKNVRRHFEVNNITMLKCYRYSFMRLLKFLREVSNYNVVSFFVIKLDLNFIFAMLRFFETFLFAHNK